MRLLHALKIILIAVIYFGLAIISLDFSFHYSNASPIWPASGFAFAILLLWKPKMAYGIFMGAFAANLYFFLKNGTCTLPTALLLSVCIGAGNTLEALAGYYLINKFLPGVTSKQLFSTVRPVYKFVVASMIMCIASSIMGSLSILIAGIIPSQELMLVWFTWWTGDVSGILLFTPFIIVGSGTFKKLDEGFPASWMECSILFVAVLLISGMIFCDWFHPGYVFSSVFIITPFLIWGAIRMDQRIVMWLLLTAAVIALWGTLRGTGAFSKATLNESLITVELFISIHAVMVLLLQTAMMERRKQESFLIAARQNLEKIVQERTNELHVKNLELVKRNSELSSFSYSASHDLREPIRKLEYFSNLLLENGAHYPEDDMHLIKRIQATTHRMNQLVENLMSYSLLEGQEKSFLPTDLNIVLREVKHQLDPIILETGAIIEHDPLPVVQGIRSQLVQLFTNILGNSLKFRKPGIPLQVAITSELSEASSTEGAAKTANVYCHLTFRDNGIGFENEYAEQVFDILQKLHGQSEYEGAGIGLAICKKVVENHKGFISAQGEPGVGTVIHVYLPLAEVMVEKIRQVRMNEYL